MLYAGYKEIIAARTRNGRIERIELKRGLFARKTVDKLKQVISEPILM